MTVCEIHVLPHKSLHGQHRDGIFTGDILEIYPLRGVLRDERTMGDLGVG